jgi:hypothetical protein
MPRSALVLPPPPCYNGDTEDALQGGSIQGSRQAGVNGLREEIIALPRRSRPRVLARAPATGGRPGGQGERAAFRLTGARSTCASAML